ncbi:MAG: hypothetical protein JSW16_02815 [Dehalococcoidales bacterium]|nr:MAG: hypothetical protein JSW16_02815 [Dehalococcoidales bacterium]
MADEVSQKEHLAETTLEYRGLSEAGGLEREPVSRDDTVEPEGLSVDKDVQLAEAIDRISELEQLVTDKDEQISVLKQAETGYEERLAEISDSLSEAIAAYKGLVIQSNPEILEELVAGDSIKTVNESLSRAKALLSRVREGVEAQISLTRVPSGSPGRATPDFSALSPREKIQYAIGKTN